MTVATKQMRRVPLPRHGWIDGYDWAPGGRRLVVSLIRAYNGPSVLYTLRRDGTHVKRLRRGSYPSWSGDGRHIAFTLNLPGVSTINVVRPDGSGFKRLSPPGSSDGSPSVSPDGSTVLFDSQLGWAGHWGMVDATGRNYRLWPKPNIPAGRFRYVCPLQWTPDGTRLATVRADDLTGRDALVSFNRAGQDERLVFPRRWTGGCGIAWQAIR